LIECHSSDSTETLGSTEGFEFSLVCGSTFFTTSFLGSFGAGVGVEPMRSENLLIFLLELFYIFITQLIQ